MNRGVKELHHKQRTKEIRKNKNGEKNCKYLK